MLTIRIKTRIGRNTVNQSRPYTPEALRDMDKLFQTAYVSKAPRRYMLVVWWEDSK